MTTTINNIIYTLDGSGTFYKVSGYTTGLTDILIQDYIGGIPVEEINADVFSYDPPGTGPYILTIPATVKYIRHNAFNVLGLLFNVSYNVSTDFSNIVIIESAAFAGATLIMNNLNLSSATLIGSTAFSSCLGVTGTLTLSPNLTTLDICAFIDTNLNKFSTLISTNLTSIVNTFGAAIPPITSYNFYNCTYLSSIDPNAFTTFTPPSFVIDVYVCPFTYDQLNINAFPNYVRINKSMVAYDTSSGEAIVTAPNSSIEHIVIPSTYYSYTVSGIANDAFYQSGFTISGTLTLPNSMVSIGSSAFKQCGLTCNLTLPNSITSIGSEAFSGNSFTGTLTLPLNLTLLEDNVFSYCRFTSIAPPTNLVSIHSYAFYNCSLYVYDFTHCFQLEYIDPTAFINTEDQFYDINVYVTQFTYDRIKNFPFPRYVKLHTGVPVSNICFVAGTMVKTDQGTVPIQTLGRKHTLRGQPIQLTKTKHDDPYLVKIHAYAFSEVPTQDTYMSMNHRVYFNRVRVKAKDLVNGDTVSLVPYNGQPLYNVLVKSHTSMEVHGMVVETLDPTSTIALLYTSKLLPKLKLQLIEKMNRHGEDEAIVIHLKRNQ